MCSSFSLLRNLNRNLELRIKLLSDRAVLKSADVINPRVQ